MKSKYIVTLTRERTEHLDVEVEAETADEAELFVEADTAKYRDSQWERGEDFIGVSMVVKKSTEERIDKIEQERRLKELLDR